jgi:hypothetical protein
VRSRAGSRAWYSRAVDGRERRVSGA